MRHSAVPAGSLNPLAPMILSDSVTQGAGTQVLNFDLLLGSVLWAARS